MSLRKLFADRPYLWASLGLLSVFSWLLADLLLGRVTVPGDSDQFFGPYYMLVADFARSGRLLTWNPFIEGGLPDFVDTQSGALSPDRLLFGLATGGTQTGYHLYLLLVWLASGLGFLLLARHLGARAWEGLTVALGYLFSGFFLGHAWHLSFLYSLAWLPVQIVLLDLALRRRSFRLAACAGVAWGLSNLGGYPSLALGNVAVALAWALGNVLWAPTDETASEKKTHWRQHAALVAVMLGIGLAVMSPIVIGFPYEAAGISARTAPLTKEAADTNSLQPLALTTFFSPYYQRLFSWELWPLTHSTSAGLYTSGLVLVFGLAGLFGRPRPLRLLLGGIGVLTLLFALGPATPFRGWVYDLLPPTRYFRNASAYRCYAMFALSVLALFGLRDLRNRPARKSWLILGCASFGALLAWSSFRHVTAIKSDEMLTFGRVHGLLTWACLSGVGLLIALTAAPWRNRVIALLLPVFAVLDAASAEHLGAWHRSDAEEWVIPMRSLLSRHSTELDLAKTTGLDRQLEATRERGFGPELNNRNFVTKQPMFTGFTGFLSYFQSNWEADSILRYSVLGEQRLWFSDEVLTLTPDFDAFDAFLARAHALRGIPLVLHEREQMLVYPPSPASPEEIESLSSVPVAVRQPYILQRYEPTLLALEIEAPRDGWLLVTDRWARGWRARVNGVETEVHPANFLFRAVPVVAGPNHVLMTYEPASLPWTLSLSWGTIVVVGLIGFCGLFGFGGGRSRSSENRRVTGPDVTHPA